MRETTSRTNSDDTRSFNSWFGDITILRKYSMIIIPTYCSKLGFKLGIRFVSGSTAAGACPFVKVIEIIISVYDMCAADLTRIYLLVGCWKFSLFLKALHIHPYPIRL